MIRGGQSPDSKSTYWGAGGAGNMIRGTEPRFYKYILVRPIYKDIIPGLSHLHGRRD